MIRHDWKPGDPARIAHRVWFYAGDAAELADPVRLPAGTLVHVRSVGTHRTGRNTFTRVCVERRDGAEPVRWAFLDSDAIVSPENFDA